MALDSILNLTKLNLVELQNISQIASGHQLMQKKLKEYSSQCQDKQIKHLLQQGSQSAEATAQNLINSL